MSLINTEIAVVGIQVILVPLVLYNLSVFKKQIKIDNEKLINKKIETFVTELNELKKELSYRHDIWIIDNRLMKEKIQNIEVFLRKDGYNIKSEDITKDFI